MSRHSLGLVGFAASALLSYSLVIAVESLTSSSPLPEAQVVQEGRSSSPVTPPPTSFRSDLIWHTDNLVTTDSRSTNCSVTGTRYISPTGERAFLMRFEFGSFGAAQRALMRQCDQAYREELEATQPIPRIGQPDEIAGAALYLASDDSSFMTGQVIVIDGGETA